MYPTRVLMRQFRGLHKAESRCTVAAMRAPLSLLLWISLAPLTLASCALPETNFSQWPGFAEYLTAHPPAGAPASAEQQALLQRFRPRFFLPPRHPGLLGFYEDYIAQGRLYAGDGKLISEHVTPAILNQHKDDPRVVFAHRPDPQQQPTAVVLGRVAQDELDLGAPHGRRRFTFLSYHAVFRHSGLPAGFAGWRARLVNLVASLDDWHQLDHYTAASVILDERQQPLALMLQQHNYQRTYVFGQDVALPADGRPLVDIAVRSNELFPHAAGRVQRKAVRLLDQAEMRYMLGFAPAPRMAAYDITQAEREAEYTLGFLPADDAFYTFKGFLGERRRLPGRDGPPGADFNTLPQLKPLGMQLLVGFWREGNREDLARFEATFAKTGNPLDFARAQAPVFAEAIAVHGAAR
jgi:hypothetical protein